MPDVTFNVRALTPIFIAGADQTQAELRAPSFRGLMRYWQRALVGGLTGTDTEGLKKVKKAETELFGATDTGSAISIRITTISGEAREFTERISVRVGDTWQATGRGYLLWSLAKSGRPEKGNVKPARWFFPPGTRFQVTLSTHSGQSAKLEQAVAAFWLLTHLGGIGSRSRRTAGSLAAQVEKNSSTDFPFETPANSAALKQQIEQGIALARDLYASERRPVREAQFDILAPGFCRIWILQDDQPWPSAEIAMQKLGERLQEYRSRIPIGRRKIFGLPLMPIIRNQRRASPLLLRVAELQGNRYVGIAVLFKTTGGDVHMEDYSIIERWANEFRGKLEVTL
jgi:CRISPR-associated protein Cmr1